MSGATAAAGWSASDLDDYRALSAGATAHERDRDVVAVAGPEALDYLQGQCSQDIAALEVGSAAESLVLSPEGRVEALVRVARRADDEFVVDVDGGFGAALLERLARFKLRMKVTLEPLEWRCLAVRWPAASLTSDGRSEVPPAPTEGTVVVAPVDEPLDAGYDLLGPTPEESVPDGLRRVGTRAVEARRIEAGLPAMGRELDGRTIPAEADLLDRAVSFTKGCYTGQELVARLDARGNRVPRRLRALRAEDGAETLTPEVLVGAELAGAEPSGRSVGNVTSAAWSPGLGAVVGLGFIHRSVEPGAVLSASLDGAEVAVAVSTPPLAPAPGR